MKFLIKNGLIRKYCTNFSKLLEFFKVNFMQSFLINKIMKQK